MHSLPRLGRPHAGAIDETTPAADSPTVTPPAHLATTAAERSHSPTDTQAAHLCGASPGAPFAGTPRFPTDTRAVHPCRASRSAARRHTAPSDRHESRTSLPRVARSAARRHTALSDRHASRTTPRHIARSAARQRTAAALRAFHATPSNIKHGSAFHTKLHRWQLHFLLSTPCKTTRQRLSARADRLRHSSQTVLLASKKTANTPQHRETNIDFPTYVKSVGRAHRARSAPVPMPM
jgi:hypothetical protein